MGRKVHTSFDTCFYFSLDVIEEKYSFRKKFITLMTIISRYPDKMFIYLANFLSYDVLFFRNIWSNCLHHLSVYYFFTVTNDFDYNSAISDTLLIMLLEILFRIHFRDTVFITSITTLLIRMMKYFITTKRERISEGKVPKVWCIIPLQIFHSAKE